MGSANARVLPEPVLPRPSTSRPARVSGSVSTWIGNAVVLPSAASDGDERSGHAERAEGDVGHRVAFRGHATPSVGSPRSGRA